MNQFAATRDPFPANVMSDSMPSAVAIFDLDGTVMRRDTFVAFLVHVLKREPWRFRRCLWLPYKTAMAAFGRMSKDDLKAAFLSAILKGITRDKIKDHAVEFVEKCVRDQVKPAAMAKINWHRAKKHQLILASASVDLYVPLLAALLGFDQAVCTRVEWAKGRLTGRLLGPNLRGNAKLGAVQEILGKKRGREIFAYSDSHLDLPLLAFADHGIAVDADSKLRREAPRSGISTESWYGDRTGASV